MPYITQGPVRLARPRGLGQDDSGDTSGQFSVSIPQTTITLPSLPTGYTDSSTFTGLPIILEVGFGLLGAWFLAKFASKTKRRVSSGIKAARRAK